MRTLVARSAERALLPVAVVLAALVVAVLQPVGGATSAPQIPAPRPLPAAIEAHSSYQGAAACDPVAKPGAKKLKALLAQTYASTAFGITRACSAGSVSSEHMEGRAVDWMIGGKAQRQDANAFLDWLLATDADGNRQAMARRMGIMYIVWDDRMYRLYDTGRGWSEYNGCFARQGAAYDTTCHRNHVHFSLSWDGAAALTSYWSGTALQPPCPSVGSTGSAPALPTAGLELVPLPPARILDSAKGVGVSTPCRLSQPAWDGDARRIDLQVAGRGGVPATGAAAVVLSLQVRDPSTDTRLMVAPTGSSSPLLRASSTAMGVNGTGSVVVPLGYGGRVSLTVPAGGAGVVADVLGYYRAPDSSTSRFHPVEPRRLLDTHADAAPLEPGETREVQVSGRGPIPDDDVTAVTVAVTVSGGTAGGGVSVYGGGDAAPAASFESLSAPTDAVRTTVLVTRVGSDGTLLVRNGDAGTRDVRLDVVGWWAQASVANGSQLRLLDPKKVLDTATGKGLDAPGPLAATQPVTTVLAGRAGIPEAGATAVALQVTALGPSEDAALLAWPAGAAQPATRAASVRGGVDHTSSVTGALGDRGAMTLAVSKGSVGVKAYRVGYWFEP